MHDSSFALPRAEVLAARGALTRKRTRVPEGVTLGDPGKADASHAGALSIASEPPILGGSFKFRDNKSVITPHSSRSPAYGAMSLPQLFAAAAAAPRKAVEATSNPLQEVVNCLPEGLGSLRFPQGVARVIRDGAGR